MATVTIQRPGFAGDTAAEQGVRSSTAPDPAIIAAASTVTETPRRWVLILAYGALAAAALVAFLIGEGLKDPLAVSLGAGAFALFYVAAQAEERLIEPFTQFILPTDATKDAAAEAKGTATTTGDKAEALAKAKEAADGKAELSRRNRERTILFWALASVIGIAASIWLGLYFFAAVLTAEAAATVPRWVDVIATGLVIGGGSKALHDLIGKTRKPAESEAES